MHPLRPGDPEKLGAYVISGRLTDGPRGTAYLGRESDDAPLRVIRLLPADPDADGDLVARLAGVQRVSSAYVARTLDVSEHDDRVYLAREHVEGRSLAAVVAEDGPLAGDALERVAVGALTALTAVHLAGITHRGLTPHNVILGPDGPRVTDIDLGEPAGEIGYRAPEQIRGLAYGPYADVFAWAATVVFAATGRAPFGQDEDAVLNGSPELGELGEPLRRVVQSALAKDVTQRPTTYMALLQLLGDKRGAAMQKLPAQPGAPLEGTTLPPQGVPVPPQAGPPPAPPEQTWGPPRVPQQAALPGGSEPMRGVPVPPPTPGWEPPREQMRPAPVPGHVSQSPKRKFPMGLVAAVGALALLSGAGLWGANQYASTQKFEPVAAAGDQAEERGSSSEKVENGASQTGRDPAQGEQPQQSQPEVTVPWASPTSGDRNDVGPMVLPNDYTGQTPATPDLSTVPTPAPIATQPIVQPTVTVTASGKDKDKATATATATPTPTKSESMVHPTVTVTPTPTVTVTATPSPTPTPTPTVTVTVTPTSSTSVPPTAAPTITTKPTAKLTPTKRPSLTIRPTAAKNPHSPVKLCGAGFYVQRSQAFNGGEVFQLYNKSTGVNCAVTLKKVDLGKATQMGVMLEVQGGDSQASMGHFEYYAGPVKQRGKGKCVRVSGMVGDASARVDWANCG